MTHVCYLCGDGRPDRAVWHSDASSRVRIPRRFEGPEGMVNGGIALATLACLVLRQAGDPGLAVYRLTGRLLRPVPFDEDLAGAAEREEDRVWQATISSGDGAFATARVELGPAAEAVWEPIPEHLQDAVARMAACAGATPDGPLLLDQATPKNNPPPPTCFGCGRPRHEGGLYLPGQLAGADVAWSAPEFTAEFDEGNSDLATAISAAATDCATGVAFSTIDGFWRRLDDRGEVAITGTLDYRWLRRVPLAGPSYRVLSTPNGTDGRKMFGIAGLFGSDGQPYVLSEGTWLTIPNPRGQA